MPKKLSYWIKKRYNSQFEMPYFTACGQLSKRDAKKKESPSFGFNVMLEYETEDEYRRALDDFKVKGYMVYGE